MHTHVAIAFFIYLIVLLIIGLVSHRKSKTEADFIMGNRSLNFWLTALSAHASDMSAWLFMAFPMTIFVGGLSQIWIAIGLVVGMFLNWHFVAPKLRRATEQYDCYTLSTFFEKRFNDQSGMIRLISAIMLIAFMTHYLSAGLIAMGLLFESLFSIDYYIGITIATLVVVIYTYMGGYITVAWTDLIQGMFLLFVIILVPVIAFFHIDGAHAILEAAQSKNISLSLIPDTSFDTLFTIFTLSFGWGLGYFGMPHIITKFMGIKNADDMYKSKYLGISWQILAMAAAGCVGLIAIAFFKQELDNPELVFVEMVKTLFPPLAIGFILCGVIAANMSTMDSQILVCASVLTEDFYKKFMKKKEGPPINHLLTASRLGVILVAIVALAIAYNKSSTVLDTVLYSWSGLGCSFGPIVLVALYSKTANKWGAIAGIIVGGVVSGIWPYVNASLTDYVIFPMIPGFFMSLLAIFVVSKLTKATTHAGNLASENRR